MAPAAPPLFSKVTEEATPAPSQPPPGLAGIIILMLALAQARLGRAPAAAMAARDFRKVSRRMLVSLLNAGPTYVPCWRCQSAVDPPRANPRQQRSPHAPPLRGSLPRGDSASIIGAA